uniref:Anoctamin n=1 Tax=Phallusia mammillata TaxID=59560 RepID=A0A6F9D5R8_9ASCI|nr:anoctamin-10-like [Phallusia mammillata]
MEHLETKPLVVVKLSPKISQEAVDWLIKRITSDKQDGGCQLEVELVKEDNLLYISASKNRLLYGAEIVGLKKEYKDGSMREFYFSDGSNFKKFEDDEFLLESEAHYIIKIELDGLRAKDEKCIPGHPSVHLYPGKSIFRRMESKQLITDLFALHNRRALNRLRLEWYRNIDPKLSSPLDSVREYFGDTISIYFAFLNFYTVGLVPLVLYGLLVWFLGLNAWQVDDNWSLAAVHVLWSAVLLEMWNRKSNELSYKWGSLGLKEWEEPRSGFRGELGINEITQRQEPTYPYWKRYIRMYFISLPIVIVCLAMAVWLMFYYFSWEFYLMEKFANETGFWVPLLKNAPSVTYSILIIIANALYRSLAEYLTDQENHRLESTYQNHLISKILLFHFANSFLCLFYIAFIYEDMRMLRMTLRNLFIVHMVISQAMETLLPYWQYKIRSRNINTTNNVHARANVDHERTELSIAEQTQRELKREVYSGTFDDYLELWLQFGYVVLFSCVYPPAALFALLNNIVEERSDAFKMSNVFRRPFGYRTSGIGAWQTAFQALSYLAVISNLALIFNSPKFLEWFYKTVPSATPTTVLMTFLVLEHVLLFARYCVSMLIPTVPRWVKVETGKLNYWSMQALKKQRSEHLRPTQVIRRSLGAINAFNNNNPRPSSAN